MSIRNLSTQAMIGVSGAWLDPAQTSPGPLVRLLQPYAGDLVAHPVSALVNRVQVDEPACLEPVEAPAAEPAPESSQQLGLF